MKRDATGISSLCKHDYCRVADLHQQHANDNSANQSEGGEKAETQHIKWRGGGTKEHLHESPHRTSNSRKQIAADESTKKELRRTRMAYCSPPSARKPCLGAGGRKPASSPAKSCQRPPRSPRFPSRRSLSTTPSQTARVWPPQWPARRREGGKGDRVSDV